MSTTDGSARPCPACNGLKYQFNKVTGMRERCPLCGGSGLESGSEIVVTC